MLKSLSVASLGVLPLFTSLPALFIAPAALAQADRTDRTTRSYEVGSLLAPIRALIRADDDAFVLEGRLQPPLGKGEY